MTRDRTSDQDIILFGEYFYNAQAFDLYPVTAHAARHAHPLEHLCRVG